MRVAPGTQGHLSSPPLDVSTGTSTVSFQELYSRLCCSTTGGPVALGSPLQCLLEGHLGDSQSLRSSAFRWGTENCKEIWQGCVSIPNKGLAAWRNTCKAALRAECFQQGQLTKIHLTTGTNFLLFQHTANNRRYSSCCPGRLHWARFKHQADTTNLFNRTQTNSVSIFASPGATEKLME